MFVFVCFCLFFVFGFVSKKPVFPPKRAFFVYFFCVFLCFSLALFHFLLFLSLSLSLSLSCSFLSSFLPVFHFLFLVLAFSFCCVCFFWFQDVLCFCFFCLWSCVVLNHNISCLFALHLVFWLLLFFCSSCFAILLFFDFWKPVKKHL